MERMTCDEVLDVETVNTMKTAAKVVVVILIIILVLVATAVGALVGWYVEYLHIYHTAIVQLLYYAYRYIHDISNLQESVPVASAEETDKV